MLILGSTSGVLIRACQMMSANFQTSFSLTLLQDSFFIFQQALELSGHTSPCSECVLFNSGLRPWAGCLLSRSFAFLLLSDPGTMRLHHLLSGSGTSCGGTAPGIHKIRGGLAHKIKACTAQLDVHRKILYSTKYDTFFITLPLQSI